MKNFSKDNYSTKRNDTENRRSQSKNNFKKGNDLNTRDNFKRREDSNRRDNSKSRDDLNRRDNFKRREDSNKRDNFKNRDDFNRRDNYKRRDDSNRRDDFNRRDNYKRRDDSNRSDDFKRRDNFKRRDDSNRRDDYERKGDIKSNEYSYLKSKEKPRNSFNQSQTRFSSNAQQTGNYSENSSKKFQLSPNDRNFEDWIWGKHSVFAALNSERPINRIWCTSEIFSSEKFYLLLKDLKSKGVLIEEVTWSRLSQLTSGAVHQGVALQHASTESISLEKLIDISKSKSSNPIIVALDGVTDPHNFGAIIRSAEAFDCKGIIVPQRRSAGLTGTVAKVAAGALEHIPVSRVVNLNRAIDELKKKGFIIIGLSGDGHVPISEFKEKAPFVVIVGAENKGISLLVQKKCDYLLKIPLKGKTSSLNASVAAAISLCYLSNN
ncbi:23S rRNA (guanosine(2251)-2'-O)-methyltransferase RlmB [Prochlorococcus sp. AH-716-N03]|nr:23S rRNA (guanosine(2251)-2'-O)-methyltransferase RlmB [Prochlorococcus sp. AH-716-N03]